MSRLRIKLALSTSLLIFFLVSASISVLIVRQRMALRFHLEESSRTFAVLTAEPICEAYRSYYGVDAQRMREVISKMSQVLPALSRLEILDLRGRVLFSSEESGSGPEKSSHQNDVVERMEASELSLQKHMEGGAEVLDIVCPNSAQGIAVRYVFSYGLVKERLRDVLRESFLIALLIIGLGVGIAILLSRVIADPLARLTEAAQKVRKGELDQVAEAGYGDEVARIAQAFNSVCEESRKNLEKLEEANLELRKVDQLKSQFLANVSHELRTPLTSIGGYVDYILGGKMGKISQSQRRGLEVVQRNLIRLIKRVDSLLSLSREEIHPDELDIRPFNLAPMVEEILGEMELESKGKGLVLELDIPGNLPPVLADRERVSEAMENLLSNAVKFTPEGGEITVKAREVSVDHRRHIELSVSDTGIGIPAQELPRIFDRFHQTDSSSRRKYPGIGLGLAIVKQIVDEHTGKIEVESEEGKGTTFHMFLPAY